MTRPSLIASLILIGCSPQDNPAEQILLHTFAVPKLNTTVEYAVDSEIRMFQSAISIENNGAVVEERLEVPSSVTGDEELTTVRTFSIVWDEHAVRKIDRWGNSILLPARLGMSSESWTSMLQLYGTSELSTSMTCTLYARGSIDLLGQQVESVSTRCIGATSEITVTVETTYGYQIGLVNQLTTIADSDEDLVGRQELRLVNIHRTPEP